MRPIGGELELQQSDYKSYFTDSGRSSLRLFLRSYNNRNKKYLLPNFFCEIIESVFVEENVDYSFYNVFNDLTIDIENINASEYDVLYIINYFGIYSDLSGIDLDDKVLIEDNVFLYDFINYNKAKNWFAFNSFRKISLLSDGSLIKTTVDIEDEHIIYEIAQFSKYKLEAKNIKYEYINNSRYSESDYIEKFLEAEKILNNQKNIYKMSNFSLEKIFSLNIEDEQKKLKDRFEILISLFGDYCANKRPSYYSFFVIRIKNRDIFRKKLMNKNIYLPVHWPKTSQDNILYEEVISIPLFVTYSDAEFDYMINKIKEIL